MHNVINTRNFEDKDLEIESVVGDSWSFCDWIRCELNSLEEATVDSCIHYFEETNPDKMNYKEYYEANISFQERQDRMASKKNKRSLKLWEFLRNLLKNSNTCPSLIKWEDFSKRTFKFVDKEKVAKLWGNRKNNSNMNYEKFSRAMRYYYRSEILQPVLGKRLVYKFGPRATGF